MSYADKIKRFREAKPTSREERSSYQRQEDMRRYEADEPSPAASYSPPRRNEMRSSYRQQNNYLDDTEPAVRSRVPRPIPENERSFALDSMVEREVQALQRQITATERDTLRRMDQDTFGGRHLLGRSLESSIQVDDLRGSAAAGAGTLGATGLLGLLKDDLRLDGKVGEEKKDPLSGDMDFDLERIKLLLADLGVHAPSDQPDYLPEGVELTIPQITNQLNQNFLEFNAALQRAENVEKAAEIAQWVRDEAMRAEGRQQAMEQKLLGCLDGIPTMDTHTADPIQFDERLHHRAVHPPLDTLRRAVDSGMLSYERSMQVISDLHHKYRPDTNSIIEGVYNGRIDPNRIIRRDIDRAGDAFDEEAFLTEDDPPMPRPLNYNPHPNLVHKSIVSTAKGIESSLTVAMDILAQRLPEKPAATSALGSMMAARRAANATAGAAASSSAVSPKAATEETKDEKASDPSAAAAAPAAPAAVPDSPSKAPRNFTMLLKSRNITPSSPTAAAAAAAAKDAATPAAADPAAASAAAPPSINPAVTPAPAAAAAAAAAEPKKMVSLSEAMPEDTIRLPNVMAGVRKRGLMSSLGFKTDMEFVDAVLGGDDQKPSSAFLGNHALRRDHFTQFLPPAHPSSLGFATKGSNRAAPPAPVSPFPGPREVLHDVRRENVVFSEQSITQYPHDLRPSPFMGYAPRPTLEPTAPPAPMDYPTAMRVHAPKHAVEGSATRTVRSPAPAPASPVIKPAGYGPSPSQFYGQLDNKAMSRDFMERKDHLQRMKAYRAQLASGF